MRDWKKEHNGHVFDEEADYMQYISEIQDEVFDQVDYRWDDGKIEKVCMDYIRDESLTDIEDEIMDGVWQIVDSMRENHNPDDDLPSEHDIHENYASHNEYLR